MCFLRANPQTPAPFPTSYVMAMRQVGSLCSEGTCCPRALRQQVWFAARVHRLPRRSGRAQPCSTAGLVTGSRARWETRAEPERVDENLCTVRYRNGKSCSNRWVTRPGTKHTRAPDLLSPPSSTIKPHTHTDSVHYMNESVILPPARPPQAQEAVKAALADGAKLVEVEFPSTTLSSVSGTRGWIGACPVSGSCRGNVGCVSRVGCIGWHRCLAWRVSGRAGCVSCAGRGRAWRGVAGGRTQAPQLRTGPPRHRCKCDGARLALPAACRVLPVGDGEGQNEMNASMGYLRTFLGGFR